MLALKASSRLLKVLEIKPLTNHLRLISSCQLLTVTLTNSIRTLWRILNWWSRKRSKNLANRLSQVNSNSIATKPCWNRVRSKLWQREKFTSSWQITKNWRKFAKEFAIQLCRKRTRPTGLRTYLAVLQSSLRTMLARVKHAIKRCDDHLCFSKNQGLAEFIQLLT